MWCIFDIVSLFMIALCFIFTPFSTVLIPLILSWFLSFSFFSFHYFSYLFTFLTIIFFLFSIASSSSLIFPFSLSCSVLTYWNFIFPILIFMLTIILFFSTSHSTLLIINIITQATGIGCSVLLTHIKRSWHRFLHHWKQRIWWRGKCYCEFCSASRLLRHGINKRINEK